MSACRATACRIGVPQPVVNSCPLGLQGDPTSPFWRRSALGFLWKEWCWSWNSSALATSCEELTHWKRPWCWEGLGAGGEGDNRGWDGWIASPTRWTWVWVNSGSWWWTGRPGVLQFLGSQRVGHDWATELNWTDTYTPSFLNLPPTPSRSSQNAKLSSRCYAVAIYFTHGSVYLNPTLPVHPCVHMSLSDHNVLAKCKEFRDMVIATRLWKILTM